MRLVVLALVMLAGAACESPAPAASPKRGPESPAASDLTPAVVAPEYRTRQRMIDTTGKVQFNEESLVRVHAPATGRVLEVFARPGDVVEPGAVHVEEGIAQRREADLRDGGEILQCPLDRKGERAGGQDERALA